MSITHSRLVELLTYDPQTGQFTWTHARRYNKGGKVAGCQRYDGYWRIRIDNHEYLAHRLAWLFMTGTMPSQVIDHIDGDPGNNRYTNLRLATQAQNLANSKLSSSNTSGHKGVWFDKRRSKWVAEKKIDGVKFNLGMYCSKEDAIAVHDEFSRLMLSGFHRTTT